MKSTNRAHSRPKFHVVCVWGWVGGCQNTKRGEQKLRNEDDRERGIHILFNIAQADLIQLMDLDRSFELGTNLKGQ